MFMYGKYFYALFLIAFWFMKCNGLSLSARKMESILNDDFVLWMEKYGKSYATLKEREFRRNTWKSNMRIIINHNLNYQLGYSSFTMAMNQYGDYNSTEFNYIFNRLKPEDTSNGMMYEEKKKAIPDSIDWRDKGAVTPVLDQGQCGSCWTFSATGALEGQRKRVKGDLVDISEQNLVDCSRNGGNAGCNGGWMNNAFIYIKKNKGIDDEKSYPYTAKDDAKCHFNRNNSIATDAGFVNIKRGSETALMEAVAIKGPIAVATDASLPSFQFYKSGVYDEPKCSFLFTNHAMVVVGYGTTEDGIDYWIVKNSWGTAWGIEGYIWMSRNKKNQCAIATYASYPIV